MIDALDIPSDWHSQRFRDEASLMLAGPEGDRVEAQPGEQYEWIIGYLPRDGSENWMFSCETTKGDAIERANAVIHAADRKGVAAAKRALEETQDD